MCFAYYECSYIYEGMAGFRLQTFKWMYNALISSNPRKDFRMYFLQPSSLLPLLMYFSDILARKECTTGVAELN